MTIRFFQLGLVLKRVGYLAGTLKKIQGLSCCMNMTQAMAVSVDAAKPAGGTDDLTGRQSARTARMLNFGDAARTPIQNATMLSDKMAVLRTQFKFTNLAALTEAMKNARPAATRLGVPLGPTLSAAATLPVRRLSSGTAGAGFLEIMTQMSRASRRLCFEIVAGTNRQALAVLETLRKIHRQFGDISKHKDIAAVFEKAFGPRAGAGIIAAWRSVKAFFATLIPPALERSVNLLKTSAVGIASGVMWPVHETVGAKRNGQAGLRAAYIAIENVVTRSRSYLPFSPARLVPLQDLHRVRTVETIVQAIQPVPMLAAIRRVAAVAAVTMPMTIVGAAMPAAGAISSPAGAVVLNYAPHVEVHAPRGDAATIEKAVMEALEKNRRQVYRMLEQVAGRRERTRY